MSALSETASQPNPDEPFGRQPEPVYLTATGDERDVEKYIRKITRVIEANGDVVIRSGNYFAICPRAVND